jgi:hypothetical protein
MRRCNSGRQQERQDKLSAVDQIIDKRTKAQQMRRRRAQDALDEDQ